MAMFLGGLEYFLDEGARHDWLADTGVRIAFMVCLIGGMIFSLEVLPSLSLCSIYRYLKIKTLP